MTIGSLFSGIGGLELGLERAGLGPVLWQCEIDPWCRAVLAKHWPNAERFEDVRDLRGSALPPVDVLCGGFPCQDVSSAGKRAGLDGERSGLWRELARVVEEARPQAVVIENVRGLLGWKLDVVAGRLSELGYQVEATRIWAEDFGSPHRRERVFLVAHTHRPGRRDDGRTEEAGRQARRAADAGGEVADSHGDGQPQPERGLRGEWGWPSHGGIGVGQADPDGQRLEEPLYLGAPDELPPATRGLRGCAGSAQPGVGRGPDGLPSWLDGVGPGGAWPAGRGTPQEPWEPPRTLAKVANRPARLRGLGNAVMPQQAYVVGLRVRELLGWEDR